MFSDSFSDFFYAYVGKCVPFAAGRSHYLHVIYTPDRNSANEVVGWIASISDITALKQTEERLLKLEKIAAAGRLAAAFAHEINNPLSSVTNALYLLKGDQSLDRKTNDVIAIAQSELARVSRIVKQNLSYYRVGAVAKELDFSTLIEQSLQIFDEKFQQAKLQVTKKITPGISITGFGDEIRQAVDNLLFNALDAMPAGGRIAISLHNSRNWRDHNQAGVRLTIADTGSGMSEEQLSEAFLPFFTTKAEKGTGLGLWVVAGVVAKHDATIKIRSTQKHGKSGTVVSILWPLNMQIDKTSILADSDSFVAGAKHANPGS